MAVMGSWVELQPSRNGGNGSGVSQLQPPPPSSPFNGELERILLDAQRESGRSSQASESPPLTHSPGVPLTGEGESIGDRNSCQSDEDDRGGDSDSPLKKNQEWVLDWSSRPENLPAKELEFLRRRQASAGLSVRRSGAMRRGGLFSQDFLLLSLPSLLVTHLLVLGLGMLLGRKLAASSSHNP
uniref:BCL2/adenovirus E1B 19 kDa protein-interacting protein 3-like n=1 Tax=Myxine glutinosa TaxID=7769 RepID=UPI00358FAD57